MELAAGAQAREKIAAIAAPPEALERIAEDSVAQGGLPRSRAGS